MNAKQHTIETLKIICLIVVLAGLLFAITTLARASETGGSTETYVILGQGAPESGVTGSQNPAREARQRRKAYLRALRAERRQERKEYLERVRREKAAAQNQAVPAAASLNDIKVSFKMDPRITRGLYMGDRWVSQAAYVGDGRSVSLEARVQGVDAKGTAKQIAPKWIPEDPKMVTASPGQGNEVTITVHRAGESSLKLISEDVSKELIIKATSQGTVIKVEISQKPATKVALPQKPEGTMGEQEKRTKDHNS